MRAAICNRYYTGLCNLLIPDSAIGSQAGTHIFTDLTGTSQTVGCAMLCMHSYSGDKIITTLTAMSICNWGFALPYLMHVIKWPFLHLLHKLLGYLCTRAYHAGKWWSGVHISTLLTYTNSQRLWLYVLPRSDYNFIAVAY